uniref:Uncharacterized protein LOC104237788 isoform X2 n=1 Tax=Nicotiana sylvestris TaxID=4096 RepID=A0A1U7XHG1_NICSY|nr:PREDICTED: uncharacterized protein LOC104237788 isoform X2 [Nicotiana sylvestris]
MHATTEHANAQNNIPMQMGVNHPPNVQEPVENHIKEEEEINPLLTESSVEFANLNEVKVLLFKEMLSKKFIFNCPPSMFKCSIDIRPPRDPTVGIHAVILVPCQRKTSNSNFEEEEMTVNPNHQPRMIRSTRIIFRNVLGANNDDFCRNFSDLGDTQKPCLVSLLETRMTMHGSLLNDFNFTEMIEVPSEGQSGGMAILYDHTMVTVNNFTRRGQKTLCNDRGQGTGDLAYL